MGYAGSGMGGLMQGWRTGEQDQQAQQRNDAYLKTQQLNQTRTQQGIDEWNAGAENRDLARQFEHSRLVATQAMQAMQHVPDHKWGEFVGRVYSELPVLGKVQADPSRSVLVDEQGEEHQVPMDRKSMEETLMGFANPEIFQKIKAKELERQKTPVQYVDAQGNVRTMTPGEAGEGWGLYADKNAAMGLRQGQATLDSTRAQEGARKAQQGYYEAQEGKSRRIDVAPGHVVFGPDGKEVARGLQVATKGGGTGSGSGTSGKSSGVFNKQNIEQTLGVVTDRFMLSKGFQKKSVYNADTQTTTTEFVDAQGNTADISALQKADKVGRMAVNILINEQANSIIEAQEMAERKQAIFESAFNEFSLRTGFSPQQKPTEFKQFLLEYSRGLDTGYGQRIPIGNQR